MLIPTPSLCAVARNSPVSENARAVQVLFNRIASIRCPVGRSHTRMTESADAAIIHRPSFEKHYSEISTMQQLHAIKLTYKIVDSSNAAPELSYHFLRVGVDYSNGQVAAAQSNQIARSIISCSRYRCKRRPIYLIKE
jgi:hypothetical protein